MSKKQNIKMSKKQNIKVWLWNSYHAPERAMASFLRKRNWVVFYLEPQNRVCVPGHCWLELYQQGEKKSNP